MVVQTLTKAKALKEPTQLCVVICGPTLNEARAQIQKAEGRADIIEFRLDQFQFSQFEAVALLKEACTLPVIFTLRRRSQGGEFSGDELERLALIRRLAKLQPAYIDLEYDLDAKFFIEISKITPNTKLISSYHDFEYPCKDLQSLFEVMKQKPAHIFKIAMMAYSSLDALRMLRFLKDNCKRGYQIIGICMGDIGKPTRILGPIFGSAIMFATLPDGLKTAPGQLNADELINIYHYRKLNPATQIYGLIGDPVGKSPSNITHNQVFAKLGLDAVYVKFNLKANEIHEFIELAKKLDFKGFSVTMPLKQSIIREVTEIVPDAQTIGAVNTIKLTNKTIAGSNTDGKGALDAIEEKGKVAGKKMVILGAGGAAKAVAWEAKLRGAKITILNRTREKAMELAQQLDATGGNLDDFPSVADQGYDILVNCTSVGMHTDREKLPIDPSHMLKDVIVMDAIPGEGETLFLHEARKRGCSIVCGNKMLMQQAIGQFLLWFGDSIDQLKLKKYFEAVFQKLRH